MQIETEEFRNKIREIWTECDPEGTLPFPDDEQTEQMRIVTEYLLSENEKFNLTAIRNVDDVIAKHLFDSATLCPYLKEGDRVIDVGCGAGFPSLPIAILRRDIRVTSLDSTGKKTEFIKKAAVLAKIENIGVLTGRAEDYCAKKSEFRESYDVCVARAVASLPVLGELCLPFVKIGGAFLAMKSGNAMHEIADCGEGLKKLGGAETVCYSALSAMNDSKIIVKTEKTANTPPEFPRLFSKIKAKPLS